MRRVDNESRIRKWVSTTPTAAASLSGRAVVAGYEGYDCSPLWVIRASYEGDLVPGKLAIKHKAAYVPWNGRENPVYNIETLLSRASQGDGWLATVSDAPLHCILWVVHPLQ
ncbi:hypothetical protein EVAR_75570_1 [Eumeta japonica]|uniref:Uncharacterized protein n=1 Tax=Eumeta variegata TaxID=151549 RepID=A0A4C1UJ40_EUMVA|nr:hypothetical protein EVAR_75570_1 [Eumeta japonica]